jgi:hypothetical protein
MEDTQAVLMIFPPQAAYFNHFNTKRLPVMTIFFCGEYRSRTGDLLHAMQAL